MRPSRSLENKIPWNTYGKVQLLCMKGVEVQADSY